MIVHDRPTPKPGSPEHRAIISASKTGGIQKVSPYDSQASTWLRMKGRIPWPETTVAMRRGHFMENAILDWWRDENPHIKRARKQVAHWYEGEPWAMATPDLTENSPRPRWVLDAKTQSRNEKWGAPGTAEVPLFYATQMQWQMACAGPQCEVGYITVLGSYLDLDTYEVPRDQMLIDAMVDQCHVFYQSLEEEELPWEWDYSVASFDAVKALHPDIDYDASVTVDDETAAAFIAACDARRAADDAERFAKVTLLAHMGTARLAQTQDGVVLARRQPNRSGVSLVPVRHNDYGFDHKTKKAS